MTTFTPDSNMLVAAVSSRHPHHEIALAELESRLNRNEEMALVGHSLIETFSVLTRIPPPDRLSPSQAVNALRELVASARVVALKGPEYLELLERLAGAGIAGGRTYDAVIGATAVEAGADVLLTFNVQHFMNLGLPLRVAEPAESHPPR